MRFGATLLFVAILLKHTPSLAFGAMVKVVVEALGAAREDGVKHLGTRFLVRIFAVSGEWVAKVPVYGSSR